MRGINGQLLLQSPRDVYRIRSTHPTRLSMRDRSQYWSCTCPQPPEYVCALRERQRRRHSFDVASEVSTSFAHAGSPSSRRCSPSGGTTSQKLSSRNGEAACCTPVLVATVRRIRLYRLALSSAQRRHPRETSFVVTLPLKASKSAGMAGAGVGSALVQGMSRYHESG